MFPESLVLDDMVLSARKERKKAVSTAIIYGIAVRFILSFIEFSGYLFSKSSALWAESISTFFDGVLSLVFLIAVTLASRPPDKEHPFGHGRYEAIAGMLLGCGLLGVGIWMFAVQIKELFTTSGNTDFVFGFWFIPLISLTFLELIYRKLIRVAKERKSALLVAEAVHFRTDAVGALVAACTLILADCIPSAAKVVDIVGAFFIAGFTAFSGYKGIRENGRELLDRVPNPSIIKKIREAALSVDGVLGTEKIRVQKYGPNAYVAIDIEVLPKLCVEEAHRLSQYVRRAIQESWPPVEDVLVHIEPYYPDDHKNEDE